MSSWILPASGIPVLITTVQCVTYLYTCTDSSKQRFEVYYKAIKEIFHRKYTEEAFAFPKIIKLTIFMLSEIAEDDKDFQSGLNKVFGNPAFKESET